MSPNAVRWTAALILLIHGTFLVISAAFMAVDDHHTFRGLTTDRGVVLVFRGLWGSVYASIGAAVFLFHP
jgi:hypothetical protein